MWSYPRPPELVREPRAVRVELGGEPVAATERALRVRETAGAPAVYVPPADVELNLLRPAAGKTLCEFKGTASYYDVVAGGRRAERGAWAYRRPTPGYEALTGYLCFYPGALECYLGDERVAPQPGGFYGGWVTAEIVGPIKGEPGTGHW